MQQMCLALRDYVTAMYKDSAVIRLTFIFAFLITGSSGALTEKPTDATLPPDGALRLNCSTDLGIPVVWQFTKDGSHTPEVMTSAGILKTNTFLAGYFMIDSSNKFDLIANNTSDNKHYCGSYECIDENGDRGAERASASVATVSSPECKVHPKSASGNETVTFTCEVSVCGSVSIPMTIAHDGTDVESGSNTATWQTTADEVESTGVTCSANFGDPVQCPKLTPATTSDPSAASSLELPALSIYALVAIVAHRLHV